MFTYRTMRFGTLIELPVATIDDAVRTARADMEDGYASPKDVIDENGKAVLTRDGLLSRADPETYPAHN